jgi:CelD/BcsL family acetyltransferase involved in cellulose biosynthesis
MLARAQTGEAHVTATIGTVTEFDAERERWDRLYRADPLSQVFLSWPWLRAFLDGAGGWKILVVRDGDELLAALPLRVTRIPSALLPVARQLSFASAPVGDYQGMLCLPGREREALRTLASAVREMRWDTLSFSDVSDPRAIELLALVRSDGDAFEATGTTRCVRAELPPTWDAYLASLGSRTRSTLRSSVRKLKANFPAFRISSPSNADVDAHIDAAVFLHHKRWGGNIRTTRTRFGRLHRAAYDRGCLRQIVMWDGERPIASTVAYVDAVRGTYNLYQLVYDSAYHRYSPGKGAIGLAIRDAIENGYAVFDFLRGYEEYKLSYARDVRTTTHHRLTRPGIRSRLFRAIQPAYRMVKAAAVRVVYGPGRAI